jgi:hypothetical protein
MLAALAAAAAVLAASAREAVPAPSGGPLVLTSFVQRGRTDIHRNAMLEFRFSAPLRRGSVDERTLQVNELIPAGRRPAVGARIVAGHVVRFNPTRTQRNYDESMLPNSLVDDRDHMLGFSGGAAFEIRLPAAVDRRVLHARDGRRLARPYVGSFRTNAVYDDPIPGQPSFSGVGFTGLLDFVPPRDAATGLVDADASILLGFSEPIDPASMRLGDTVIVQHATDGSDVPGTVTPAPDRNGSVYLFTPTGGFGSAAAGQGWDIRVALKTGITDLAGNPLVRTWTFPVFRTRLPK